MALSKKGSRSIVVDAVTYRWSSSEDSGYMVLVVQHGSGTGCKLEVVIPDGRNIVVANDDYTWDVEEQTKLAIVPSLVEKIIRDAIQLGWQAEQKSSPLQLSIRNMFLQIRHPN